MAELYREVLFEPGYDFRKEDEDKPLGRQRGCHGMNIRFLLTGPEGVVQFLVYTHWLPNGSEVPQVGPTGADLGYHWLKPTGPWNTPRPGCEFLGGETCHYDGSGLAAQDLLAVLVGKGHEPVWQKMEEWYEDCRIRAAEHENSLDQLVGELHTNLIGIKEKIE